MQYEYKKVPRPFRKHFEARGLCRVEILALHKEFQEKFESFIYETLTDEAMSANETGVMMVVFESLSALTGIRLPALLRNYGELRYKGVE